MNIQVIHNEEAYEAALRELERLMDKSPEPGSKSFAQMELLALVVHDHEARQFPVMPPDPIDAIRFRMEQQGTTRRDLVKTLGSRARVSEVLNRRRGLSVSMVRNLHRDLGIPVEVLIAESKRFYAETPKRKKLRTVG
ncbi:MAG TPA: transcriptional regulator [Verrucomicrobiae bacterium]